MLTRRLLVAAAWIAVALAFAAFLAGHADSCRRASARVVGQRKPQAAYVGGDACRSCHDQAAGTLAAGGMGRSSCPPATGRGAGDPSPLIESGSDRRAAAVPSACDVDCERCHGPGETHVNLRRDPPDAIPDRDATIINPGKLIPGPRMHVCLACHLGDPGSRPRSRGPHRRLPGVPPGGPGSSAGAFAAPPATGEGAWAGDQGDRLMRSRCFQVSGAAIDCLTCHDPHRSVRAREHAPDHFRRACLTCHTAGSCALPEPERRALSAADECVACHMPRGEASDRHPGGSTDHWIRRRIEHRTPSDAGRSVRRPGPIKPV